MKVLRCKSGRNAPSASRKGASLVEFALVAPLFFLFLMAIMEFGHAYLVIATLNSAAKKAARMGVTQGVSTADIIAEAQQLVEAAVKPGNASYYVKDASFLDHDSRSTEKIDYSSLPDVELATADSMQMYVVRIEINYSDVALLPPVWTANLTLSGTSATRCE